MKKHQLQAISPIDGRYAEKCAHLRDLFSEASLIKYRVITEIKWLQFLAQEADIKDIKMMPNEVSQGLQKIIDEFSIEEALQVKEIESEINHDVKAVEYYLQDKLSSLPNSKDYIAFIHFGCTSEDINNISYALMIQNGVKAIRISLEEITSSLRSFSHQWHDLAMLAHTHGQPATPTTMGKEFANFLYRLEQQFDLLDRLKYKAKMNGAVGNFNAHKIAYPNIDWPKVSENFLQTLNLTNNPYTTQIEPHDWIAELFHCMIRMNNILLNFSKDLWLYISMGYFEQLMNSNEVGSSTMPHKINPIDFENAEGNLGIANALLAHLSSKLSNSRMQRDLSDSTALRNIGSCFGHTEIACSSLKRGLGKIRVNEAKMKQDLDAHWEIIAEAIQTILRREHIDNAYEQLKNLTRGEDFNKNHFEQFIQSLDVSKSVQQELLDLSPNNYLGFASILAKKI